MLRDINDLCLLIPVILVVVESMCVHLQVLLLVSFLLSFGLAGLGLFISCYSWG